MKGEWVVRLTEDGTRPHSLRTKYEQHARHETLPTLEHNQAGGVTLFQTSNFTEMVPFPHQQTQLQMLWCCSQL